MPSLRVLLIDHDVEHVESFLIHHCVDFFTDGFFAPLLKHFVRREDENCAAEKAFGSFFTQLVLFPVAADVAFEAGFEGEGDWEFVVLHLVEVVVVEESELFEPFVAFLIFDCPLLI